MPNERLEKLYGIVNKNLKKREEGRNKISQIHRATDEDIVGTVKWGLPTRIAELDLRLGYRGGLPAGRTVELYALPYCGKSSLALQIAASAQKSGGEAAVIETEKNWDSNRAKALGCDLDKLLIGTTDTVEGIFRLAEDLVGNVQSTPDAPFVVIVDSAAGVATEDELAKDVMSSEIRPGHEARQIKAGMRRLNRVVSRTESIVIFVNHAIATFAAFRFAKQTKAGGGNALGFLASVRLSLQSKGNINVGSKEEKEWLGQHMKINIEKLRGAVIKDLSFDMTFLNETGFDPAISLLNAGVETQFLKTMNSNTFAIWPGTEQETDFKVAASTMNYEEWHQILDQFGGLDVVYDNWREHAIKNGIINPWEAVG